MGSASVGNILLDKDILLESGTNELEVLVFGIGENTFGINVAKVREVFPRAEITRLAKAHASVCGVFKLRDSVIPCVSLVQHLKLKSEGESSEGTMILADFNRQQTAFLVDHVDRIYRLSWENILAVPKTLERADTPVTAVARIDEKLVMMLDFETILDEVTDKQHRATVVANPLGLRRDALHVLMADDSPTVRQAVRQTMIESGYTNLQICENGKIAWDWLVAKSAGAKHAHEVIDMVVSDVEMPLIDGFHLTKKIKEHPLLKSIPVLLYSSIVTPDNLKKGNAVGADAQISKPELDKIVGIADDLISKLRPEMMQHGAANTTATQDVPEEATEATSAPQMQIAVQESSTEAVRAPSGSLWMTMLGEMTQHVCQLRSIIERTSDSASGRANEALRILHTIKSAAMVVPVEELTRATHATEDLLTDTRDQNTVFPNEALGRYCDWLEAVGEASDNELPNTLGLFTMFTQELVAVS